MANSTIVHATGTGTLEATYLAAAHHTFTPGDDVVLPAGLSTILWAIPTADGTYTGIAVTRKAGENVTVGQVCYYKSDLKMWKADANAAATMPALYMATGTINANADGAFLVMGFLRHDAWAFAAAGALLYVSAATTGAITETPPAGAGDQVQVVGQVIAITTDTVWFNPSPVLVEVV
jgi:hypothetical protein